MSGARAALHFFGVPDAEHRAEAYARAKQQKVVALIEAGEFSAYDDALRFVLAMRGAGIRMAAASSSKNAALVLEKVRLGPGLTLLDALDADVSGRDLAHGKPHPEIFLVAARRAGPPAGECFVSRTPSRASRRRRRATWRRSGWRAPARPSSWPAPVPTWWSRRSTTWTSISCQRADWRPARRGRVVPWRSRTLRSRRSIPSASATCSRRTDWRSSSTQWPAGASCWTARTLWNVNSTAHGGGVAEMLRSLIGYVRGVGVDARWITIGGDPEFFRVTKRLHNRLHGYAGDGGPLGEAERAVYERAAPPSTPSCWRSASGRATSCSCTIRRPPA